MSFLQPACVYIYLISQFISRSMLYSLRSMAIYLESSVHYVLAPALYWMCFITPRRSDLTQSLGGGRGCGSEWNALSIRSAKRCVSCSVSLSLSNSEWHASRPTGIAHLTILRAVAQSSPSPALFTPHEEQRGGSGA